MSTFRPQMTPEQMRKRGIEGQAMCVALAETAHRSMESSKSDLDVVIAQLAQSIAATASADAGQWIIAAEVCARLDALTAALTPMEEPPDGR